ncbi:glyoxalase superfamily protein [Rhizobium sp. LC145]|uniref:glyoxalase superfamily protein n=1 Tax=Rhizobium sp. LC145 TaxID=1120688 RepID=UPI00062A2DF5|nr:glyoxalase superfamily protein [Rhizobium sp. LC145]KKX33384.1 hypothetical protein YH62_07755 [Rhizobium sp. LC145]TKT58633.1 hypothetical protein FDR95_10975 [Rhizobiaceae bacterium LC148]
MQSFLDAKTMARALRQSMSERKVELSHSEALDIVARQFGVADWNVLAAKIGTVARKDKAPLELPVNWLANDNSGRGLYRMGLDPAEPGTVLIACSLDRSASIGSGEEDFATLMQSISADAYRGKRVRFAAALRTEDADVGSIWLRVDDAAGAVLAFDNMIERKSGALHGTMDWTVREIVLDVSAAASSIHYGVLLQGFGNVRARDVGFGALTGNVATTGGRPHLERPANLDFDRYSPIR